MYGYVTIRRKPKAEEKWVWELNGISYVIAAPEDKVWGVTHTHTHTHTHTQF